ncbi:phospholipase A [Chitiniphilus purpureus]|uniref:Phospholipase A1 n=1 Tax=Chitiniphilus purpureus TaxID=2981137 RepID=A0ABY6DJS1_9NEIS|nr:phospholipase A [Chitiniphilus sp. CD1]UXY14609.1 phospholipase A [Chitiniphilus sp. CD1]
MSGCLLGLAIPVAPAVETVFMTSDTAAQTVEVLYVNRGRADEAVTPSTTLFCPGSRLCDLTQAAAPFTLAPDSARLLRYAVRKPVQPTPPSVPTPLQPGTPLPAEVQIQNTAVTNYAAARFAPLEPMYFLMAPDGEDARFQFSFRYQLFDPDSALARRMPWLAGLRFAYSQTSLWNLSEDSTPFYDTSYKPAFYYERANLARIPYVDRFDLAYGFRHESNGKGGSESRDLNQLFINPTFNWGDVDDLHLIFSPVFATYLTEMDENPDIAGYRGYVDWHFKVGDGQGLTAALLGRYGSKGKGSVQVDLAYPLRAFGADFFAYLQYWDGYGESLRSYDRRTNSLRLGIGFVR